MKFKELVSSFYIIAEQTEDNWRGEDCEDYDDSEDVCLDDED